MFNLPLDIQDLIMKFWKGMQPIQTWSSRWRPMCKCLECHRRRTKKLRGARRTN